MVDKRFESRDVHQALAHVAEELGEASAAVGKTMRFGLLSYNPDLDITETNIEWALRELEDVEIAVKVLKAFLKASKNDNTGKWDYEVPGI